MLAAGQTNATNFISLSGTGYPVQDVIEADLNARITNKTELAAAKLFLIALESGNKVKNIPDDLKSSFARVFQNFPTLFSAQELYISWMKYDPMIMVA